MIPLLFVFQTSHATHDDEATNSLLQAEFSLKGNAILEKRQQNGGFVRQPS
jgi:hypothetical protein